MAIRHKELEDKVMSLLQTSFGNSIRIFNVENWAGLVEGRWVQAGIKGCADIIAVLNHRGYPLHLEIEVKAGKDRQSKAQKAHQRVLEAIGGFYTIVREDDYINICDKINEFLTGVENGRE